MRVLSLADSETLVLTNYHDDAIKELSLGSTADITADAVPIDEARAVIYAETAPTRTKYLWITDTATGLSLSYIVAQINNKGDNLYEIIAYTAIYLLESSDSTIFAALSILRASQRELPPNLTALILFFTEKISPPAL